jgi:hypothetical protein
VGFFPCLGVPPVGYNGLMKHPTITSEPFEIIGDWAYLHSASGDLYRARAALPAATRSTQFVVPREKAEFALRLARIAAGLPERGKRAIPPGLH